MITGYSLQIIRFAICALLKWGAKKIPQKQREGKAREGKTLGIKSATHCTAEKRNLQRPRRKVAPSAGVRARRPHAERN